MQSRAAGARKEVRMTRSIVIVSLWLLLVDGIVKAMHAATGSPLRLLAFY